MRNTARAFGATAALLAALALAGCSDEGSVAEDPAETSSAPSEPTEVETTESSSAPAEPTSSAPSTPSADTLITLETPAEGATVSGSFEARGTANSPEANVPWQILAAGGAVALEGFFTAEGWMDALYPYAGTVDVSTLAPGEYVFRVSIDDPSGGEGNPPQSVERHITVQ